MRQWRPSDILMDLFRGTELDRELVDTKAPTSWHLVLNTSKQSLLACDLKYACKCGSESYL